MATITIGKPGRMLTKSAWDCKHVKSVHGFALLHAASMGNCGGFAGKIAADYSDNPNGSVCTATICAWAGPLADAPKMTGQAGGCGYDKLSSAISDALNRAGVEHPHFAGAGMSEVEKWLGTLGYTVLSVV